MTVLAACEEAVAPPQPAAEEVTETVAVTNLAANSAANLAANLASKTSAPAPSTHERITVDDDGTVTPMAVTACAPNSIDDPMRRALVNGQAEELTEKAVVDFASRLADCRWERAQAIQQAITEGLPPITWNASHDQPRLSLSAGDTMPLLLSNATGKNSTRRGEILAAASLLHTRSIALSANQMRTGMGPGMEEFLTRTLTFLSGGKADPDGVEPFTVAISQMSDSYYFRDRTRTREWLDATYGERVSFARAHVTPLPDFPVRFYLAEPTAACDGFPTEWLPIDGTSKWPDSTSQERVSEWVEPKASESCDLH